MDDHDERGLAWLAGEVTATLPLMNPLTLNQRQLANLRRWVGLFVQHSGRPDGDLSTTERNAVAELSRSLRSFVFRTAQGAIGFNDWGRLFAADYQSRSEAWSEFAAAVEKWDRLTFREKTEVRGAFSLRSVDFCSDLRAVLEAVDVTRFDGMAARKLEAAFYQAKRSFSFVRYYRERYHEETGTHYSFGQCALAEELQDAITRLYYDFEPVIHAIAARFKWQPDQAANLFRKAGSERYILAWSALIAAAESQTADSSPATIAAPQDRSAAFTAADSRQPVVEWSNPRSPQQWRLLLKNAGQPHSERGWPVRRRKAGNAITGEPKNCRITRELAAEWGLRLPEFEGD